ncbi:MAG: ATPase, T2SS/T4P/T4SS family, partial [Myxococcota bacterium]
MDEVISILDNSELLSFFPQNYKEQISKHLRRMEFGKGETIFKEGDPGDALYLIHHGTIGVYTTDKAMGFDFELARLSDNECFGEMAFLTEEPRSATCRAIDPSVVFALSNQVFKALLEGAPKMAVALCRILARRVQTLNATRGVKFQNLDRFRVDPKVCGMIPVPVQLQYRLIPLDYSEGVLAIATPNVQNAMGFDAVRRIMPGVRIRPVLVSDEDYQKFIRNQAPAGAAATPAKKRQMNIQYFSESDDKEDKTRSVAGAEDASTVLNAIISEAVELESSDIHIEPLRDGTLVRFRVDGRLRKKEQIIHRSLHKGISQDGRFSITADGRDLDVRISTMQTKNGEKAVLRILDSANALIDLPSVILSDKVYQAVNKMVRQPHGVILITGPTGSGKTTTMYSMLMERKSHEIHIATVEDPIEYAIPDIIQTQVNESIGLGFADVLRTFLRQDTDIILIGETRDSKTAHIALEAGLTGKLVLTSFHTNDTIGAIVRLRQMGCEAFTISNALQGVISQRLLRRLCPVCAEPFQYPEPVINSLVQADVFSQNAVSQMYRPRGCPECKNTGFKGRVAALEVLIPNEAVRHLININAAPAALLKVANEKGARLSLARYCSFLLSSKLT